MKKYFLLLIILTFYFIGFSQSKTNVVRAVEFKDIKLGNNIFDFENRRYNYLGGDSDNDGLTDIEEEKIGTDFMKVDSDNDGYSDYAEINTGYNPLGPGKIGSFLKKEECKFCEAEKARDINGCKSLDDERLKDSCISNIAYFNSDKELCKTITKGRDICLFNVSSLAPDINICNDIKSYFREGYCFARIAVFNNDKSLCYKGRVTDIKNQCLFDFSVKENDVSICGDLSNYKGGEDLCYFEFAKLNKDKLFCELIKVKETRKKCLTELSSKDWESNNEPWNEEGEKGLGVMFFLVILLFLFFVFIAIIYFVVYLTIKKAEKDDGGAARKSASEVFNKFDRDVKAQYKRGMFDFRHKISFSRPLRAAVFLLLLIFVAAPIFFIIMRDTVVYPRYSKNKTKANEIRFAQMMDRKGGELKDDIEDVLEKLKPYGRYYELIINNVKYIKYVDKAKCGGARACAGGGVIFFAINKDTGRTFYGLPALAGAARDRATTLFASMMVHEANHLEYQRSSKWRKRFFNIYCSPFLNTNISLYSDLDKAHAYNTVEICAEKEQIRLINELGGKQRFNEHGLIYYFYVNLKNTIKSLFR